MITTGASAASDAPRSVHDGSFDAAGSRPGTYVRIDELGLKPSLRSHSAGSMCTPLALAGRPVATIATRRPVFVEGSSTV